MRNLLQRFFEKFNAYFWLRFGLGIMFFYSGYQTVSDPMIRSDLFKNVPSYLDTVLNYIPLEVWFRLLGILELVIAVILLAAFLPKRTAFWAGLAGTLDIILILVVFGLSEATMAYVGALGASLAVTLFYKKRSG